MAAKKIAVGGWLLPLLFSLLFYFTVSLPYGIFMRIITCHTVTRPAALPSSCVSVQRADSSRHLPFPWSASDGIFFLLLPPVGNGARPQPRDTFVLSLIYAPQARVLRLCRFTGP